ncbi:MAG: hypothetical protein FWH35_09710 [Treponema sp.]|nr:hypothetical protein [Treponema sp.]
MAKSKITEQIAKESIPMTFIRVLSKPYLRTTALLCIASIFRNFFLLQYRAAFLPGRIPVNKVDHPLDKKIPFLPGKVNVYLDFVAFWVRCTGFLVRSCGREVFEPVRNFLESMGNLYAYAAEVYSKNLSTTERPFYIKKPRFLLIHLVDPHLMCIPSLHVMVVIRTYTLFRDIIKKLDKEAAFSSQAEELFQGALDITEAVLYVKQHSVNCISAAMYAMSCFDPRLFPSQEAGRFVSYLFARPSENNPVNNEDGNEIREHIVSLYRHFLAQKEAPGTNPAGNWIEPLLDFLKKLPHL